LRSDGHDVFYVREAAPGAEDEVVLRTAAEQDRLLLTEDKNFGKLVVRLGLAAHGILLLRMNPADSAAKLDRPRAVMRSEGHRLAGSFVVIDPDKVRIRPLRSP